MYCGNLNGKEIQKGGDNMCMYVWQIHFAVQYKIAQHCKANSNQIKVNFKKNSAWASYSLTQTE